MHQHDLFSREINDTKLQLWKLGRVNLPQFRENHQLLISKLRQLKVLPGCLHKIFRFSFLDSGECLQLLSLADEIAHESGWSEFRHENFPTRDIAIMQSPELMAMLEPVIRDRLYSLIGEMFSLDAKQLFLIDLFVVNYQMDQQRQLALHEDTSLLTFSCLLKDPMHFRGGGLYIKDIDQSIQLNQGEAVAHAGKWLHAGLPITSGRRVVLVGFIGYNLIDHEALAY